MVQVINWERGMNGVWGGRGEALPEVTVVLKNGRFSNIVFERARACMCVCRFSLYFVCRCVVGKGVMCMYVRVDVVVPREGCRCSSTDLSGGMLCVG